MRIFYRGIFPPSDMDVPNYLQASSCSASNSFVKEAAIIILMSYRESVEGGLA